MSTLKPKYMTLKDAATYSGLSKTQIRSLVEEKRLRAYRPGRKILVELAEIEGLIQGNNIEAKPMEPVGRRKAGRPRKAPAARAATA